MTIAYVGGAYTATTQTSTNVTIPSGAASGQLCVLDFAWNSSSATFTSITGVTGWTQVDTEQVDASMLKRTYYKILAPGDPGSVVTVTISVSVRVNVSVEVYSGTDTTTPIHGFAWAIEPGTNAAHAGAALTTTVDGCMIYTSCHDKAGALTSWTQPTGFTLRHTGFTPAVAISGATADFLQSTHGTITPDAFTADTATDKAISLTLALSPPIVAPSMTFIKTITVG